MREGGGASPGEGRQVWTTARYFPLFSQSGRAPASACPRPSPCASPVLLFLCRSPTIRSLRPTAPFPCARAVSTSRRLLRLLRFARRPLSSERSVSARTPLLRLLVPFMKRLRHHVFNVPLSCRWQPREQSPAKAAATTSEGGRSGGGTGKEGPERQKLRACGRKGQRPGSFHAATTLCANGRQTGQLLPQRERGAG